MTRPEIVLHAKLGLFATTMDKGRGRRGRGKEATHRHCAEPQRDRGERRLAVDERGRVNQRLKFDVRLSGIRFEINILIIN